MKSGRFIGVMSGTSLDGVDVVLAAINENLVAQQASLTYPIPIAIKEDILAICQGQQLTLSQLGRLDTRLGRLFADAVLALMAQEKLKAAKEKVSPDVACFDSDDRLPWPNGLA